MARVSPFEDSGIRQACPAAKANPSVTSAVSGVNCARRRRGWGHFPQSKEGRITRLEGDPCFMSSARQTKDPQKLVPMV